MVIDTIKQNPIPAAIAGISLAWLYMQRPSNQASSAAYGAGSPYRAPGSYPLPRPPEPYPSAPEQSTLATVGDSVRGVASQASDVASDVASSAGELASSAGETALDTGSSIVDLIRRNPMPAALVGLGLGWLYMNRSSGTADSRTYSGAPYRPGFQATGEFRRAGYQAVPNSKGGVGDMARQVGDQVGEVASSVQEQASEMAGAAMDYTTQAPGQLQRMIEENPLMTAALAASLGAAVGLALPRTQSEDQIMGSTRDRVMGQAKDVTSQTMDKVQGLAQEVQTTVSEQAKAQGLTV
jgi:hypothetical protein